MVQGISCHSTNAVKALNYTFNSKHLQQQLKKELEREKRGKKLQHKRHRQLTSNVLTLQVNAYLAKCLTEDLNLQH